MTDGFEYPFIWNYSAFVMVMGSGRLVAMRRIHAESDADAVDALLASLPAHTHAKRSWWSRLKSFVGPHRASE